MHTDLGVSDTNALRGMTHAALDGVMAVPHPRVLPERSRLHGKKRDSSKVEQFSSDNRGYDLSKLFLVGYMDRVMDTRSQTCAAPTCDFGLRNECAGNTKLSISIEKKKSVREEADF